MFCSALFDSLHVIFIFGSVFKNACELCVVKVALFVDGSLSEELIHIFICEAISHGGQQLSQVVFMNEACRYRQPIERERNTVML